MNRKISRSIVIGIGDTGRSVIAGIGKRLSKLSGGIDIPIVSLIEICDERCSGGNVESNHDEILSSVRRLVITTHDLEEEESLALPPEYRKLMDERRPIFDTRQGGGLLFFENAPIIAETLGEELSKIISAESVKVLSDINVEPRSSTDIDIFVIGDLGDPFSSSMIVDLPYLAQYEADRVLSNERIYNHYTGFWFLPSFPDVLENVDDVEKRRELENLRGATAYAALKELDSFMDQSHYEKVLRVGRLKIEKNTAPYDYVYVIDSVNESNQGIPVLSQMVELLSEWIYLALTTEMGEYVRVRRGKIEGRSYGKLAIYSGLGFAAYRLPIDELIRVESLHLGVDMTGAEKGILYEPPPDTKTGLVFNIENDAVKSEIVGGECAAKIKTAMSVQTKAFSNIPPYDLKTFFDRVGKTFEYSFVKRLGDIERCMSNRLGTLIEEKEKHIRDRAFGKVDEEHVGGISLALRALREESEKIDRWIEQQRGELRDKTNALEKESKELKEAMAAHVSSVYAFYPEEMYKRVLVWLALVGFIVLAAWFSITSFLFAKDSLAYMIAGLRGSDLSGFYNVSLDVSTFLFLASTFVAIALSIYAAAQWWSRTRAAYIDSHRTRLSSAAEKLQTEMMLHFYEGIQDPVQGIVADMVSLRDKVEEVKDTLQKTLNEPHRLYGTLGLLLTESVIKEEDVGELYRRVVGDSMEEEIRDFSQDRWIGPVSRWLDLETGKIVEAIMKFGEHYMRRIREEIDAETYLKKHAVETVEPRHNSSWNFQDAESVTLHAVQEKIKRLVDNSKPFLRYNTTALESSVDPYLTQAIGFYRAKDDKSVVRKVIDKIKESTGEGRDSSINVRAIPDKFSIVAMSARHGVPLYAIGVISAYRNQYAHRRTDKESRLHLQTKYLVLPDIFPMRYEGENILEPQAAVALGIAFEKIKWNSRKKSFTYRYFDRTLHKEVPVLLGSDKTIATIYLQDHVDILAMISREIDEEVTRRSKVALKETGSNQSIIDFLIDYREKAKRSKSKRRSLEEWEDLVIEDYVRKLSV